MIMKDDRPETAAQYLSQKNKKLSLGKSTPSLPKIKRSNSRAGDSSIDKQKSKLELAPMK